MVALEFEGIKEHRNCAVSSSVQNERGSLTDGVGMMSGDEGKGAKDKEVSHRDEVIKMRTAGFHRSYPREVNIFAILVATFASSSFVLTDAP